MIWVMRVAKAKCHVVRKIAEGSQFLRIVKDVLRKHTKVCAFELAGTRQQ